MSFSSDVKDELCKIKNSDEDSTRAELYGYYLFGKSFSISNIMLGTEHKESANRFGNMLTQAVGCITEITSSNTNKKSNSALYTISVPYENDRKNTLKYFSHTGKEINLRINKAIIESAEQVSAFLRGAFLCCGSVSDPNNEYHIEFTVPYMNLANDLASVIAFAGENITDCPLKPKIVVRKGNYVVYLKDKDMIAELLAIMGAFSANILMVQIIIQKDIINKTNRKTNSEIANSNKTAKAAAIQLDAIKTIMYNNQMGLLPEELRELCLLRLNNPEMSLK